MSTNGQGQVILHFVQQFGAILAELAELCKDKAIWPLSDRTSGRISQLLRAGKFSVFAA